MTNSISLDESTGTSRHQTEGQATYLEILNLGDVDYDVVNRSETPVVYLQETAERSESKKGSS